MLITKSLNDKSRSVYKCDMCNKEIMTDEVNKIEVIKAYKRSKKYWDLCNNCLRKLAFSIKKYRNKKGEN